MGKVQHGWRWAVAVFPLVTALAILGIGMGKPGIKVGSIPANGDGTDFRSFATDPTEIAWDQPQPDEPVIDVSVSITELKFFALPDSESVNDALMAAASPLDTIAMNFDAANSNAVESLMDMLQSTSSGRLADEFELSGLRSRLQSRDLSTFYGGRNGFDSAH